MTIPKASSAAVMKRKEQDTSWVTNMQSAIADRLPLRRQIDSILKKYGIERSAQLGGTLDGNYCRRSWRIRRKSSPIRTSDWPESTKNKSTESSKVTLIFFRPSMGSSASCVRSDIVQRCDRDENETISQHIHCFWNDVCSFLSAQESHHRSTCMSTTSTIWRDWGS